MATALSANYCVNNVSELVAYPNHIQVVIGAENNGK